MRLASATHAFPIGDEALIAIKIRLRFVGATHHPRKFILTCIDLSLNSFELPAGETVDASALNKSVQSCTLIVIAIQG